MWATISDHEWNTFGQIKCSFVFVCVSERERESESEISADSLSAEAVSHQRQPEVAEFRLYRGFSI